MYRIKRILLIIFQILLLGGVLWYLADSPIVKKKVETTLTDIQQNAAETNITFPAPSGSFEQTFEWSYAGKKYSVSQTFYNSYTQYYQTLPREYSYAGALPADWQEKYYGIFLDTSAKDQTIKALADKITTTGKKQNLSDDQIVDLVIAFVQTITYDDAKAANITSQTGNTDIRYPYEVLLERAGVCSEKSILAAALLRHLGYGNVLLAFEQANHMAVGIKCPSQYANYPSGYCYAETTTEGNRVGIIPQVDTNKGKAVGMSEVQYFGSSDGQQTNLAELASPDFYQKQDGKEYRGIIATIKTNEEIQSLSKQIASMRSQLKELSSSIAEKIDELQSMKKKMDKYEKAGDVDEYNEMVKPYNKLADSYSKDVSSYNTLVDSLNQKVKRYNSLVSVQ